MITATDIESHPFIFSYLKMILTVTLNPLLESRYIFKKINFPDINKEGKFYLNCGGKGINVSRQLNCLNLQNVALTFAGGINGKIFKSRLETDGIKFSTIRTKAEVRSGSSVIDLSERKTTSFISENTFVTNEEAYELKQKMEKMLINSEIIVFAGSSPSETTNEIFPYGIQMANKLDRISVCDTYGSHLSSCLDASPTIVHNNIKELEGSLNISLKTQQEKSEYIGSLYKKGIKQVFLTDGRDETVASTFDFNYRAVNPQIDELDPAGSGDAFVAGIVYSHLRSFNFEKTLQFASALGALNAGSYQICNIPLNEAENFMDRIKIYPLGKRMKKLNVQSS